MLEQSIAEDDFTRWFRSRADEEREMRRAIEKHERELRLRDLVTSVHRLEKAPEASDPESPAAEEVQRLHRVPPGGGPAAPAEEGREMRRSRYRASV